MKEDEINKALGEYYRVVTEEAKNVGTQKIRVFTSSIMCMALFLTFMGLLITQMDKMVFSFNLITRCIVVIGSILFLFFISFMSYYLFLRILNNNIFAAAMEIEKLQREILFKEPNLEYLQERFEKIHPFLNISEYEVKRKNLFFPKRE